MCASFYVIEEREGIKNTKCISNSGNVALTFRNLFSFRFYVDISVFISCTRQWRAHRFQPIQVDRADTVWKAFIWTSNKAYISATAIQSNLGLGQSVQKKLGDNIVRKKTEMRKSVGEARSVFSVIVPDRL